MQHSRRQFIRQAALTTAAVAASSAVFAHIPQKKLKNIGLITGTIRKPLEEDYRTTLKKVAQMGYRELEFGNHFGESASEFKAFLKDLGLRPVAGGSSMSNLQKSLDQMMEDANKMGKDYLVCYWPWTDDGKNKKLDDFKALGDTLNSLGERCKQNGLRLAYHNHAIEFEPTEGQIPYDTLLPNTDPALVTYELDLYWVTKGNADPLTYLKRYPDRFELFHVKDMDNTDERSFACVGDGIIDFQAIFEEAEKIGVKHYIVEHDRPEQPMECIQTSINYLKKVRV